MRARDIRHLTGRFLLGMPQCNAVTLKWERETTSEPTSAIGYIGGNWNYWAGVPTVPGEGNFHQTTSYSAQNVNASFADRAAKCRAKFMAHITLSHFPPEREAICVLVGDVRTRAARRALAFDGDEHVPSVEERQAPVERAGVRSRQTWSDAVALIRG